MTADAPLPETLRGGYHRADLTDVTLGADAAVLYHDEGRNVRKGTVQAVELTGGAPRVELLETSTRVADRLVVEPVVEDEERDGDDADGPDETPHRVLLETPFRTHQLGLFLALYVRGAD